ncbi:MAG TPA: class I SAM-dependent methyltransferase [Pyrinomonadaceae bacterium]|nr:class I SAM-dependent methyltransferase [Pyrinomonadaceae bacterium]
MNTSTPNQLREVLSTDNVRLIDEDIYSVLPDDSSEHHYDRRASIYDLVVSTHLYNFVMWGSSPRDYANFGSQAINFLAEGILLDAPCGSLLFTAPAYLQSHRQIVAIDQSVAMLKRARKRLVELAGSMPSNVTLLQADLSDLPFRPGSFRTVLCMNVLHLFQDAAGLISSLNILLTNEGCLFLTSLVSSNRFIGDAYLRALYLTKEFVRPRSRSELEKIINDSGTREVSLSVKGNMAFVIGKS